MHIELIAFTQKGCALGQKVAAQLCAAGHTARFSPGCGSEKAALAAWTQDAFHSADALVFVGAVGIAVRSVAKLLVSKTTDPAVVVIDDLARFCVPVVSGHLGGANALAQTLARWLGAVPVITTATDGNGVFAVDTWAARQNLHIANPAHIKTVSAKLLAGQTVRLRSDFPVEGALPQGVVLVNDKSYDVRITLKTTGKPTALRLVPQIATVGVGCRRGIAQEALDTAFAALLAKGSVHPAAVCRAASIDLKAGEPALLAFCAAHGLPLQTFSAQQLNGVKGSFTASAFVQKTTGTDNVCERSAVLAGGGTLYVKKNAGNGVTMALALADYTAHFQER